MRQEKAAHVKYLIANPTLLFVFNTHDNILLFNGQFFFLLFNGGIRHGRNEVETTNYVIKTKMLSSCSSKHLTRRFVQDLLRGPILTRLLSYIGLLLFIHYLQVRSIVWPLYIYAHIDVYSIVCSNRLKLYYYRKKWVVIFLWLMISEFNNVIKS